VGDKNKAKVCSSSSSGGSGNPLRSAVINGPLELLIHRGDTSDTDTGGGLV